MEIKMSNVEITDKITEYYNDAVIHMAWMVRRNEAGDGSERYLVFGLVECCPKELEYPLTICEQGNRFNGGRLYYIRITKPVGTAVEWYRSVKENGFITIDWEEHEQENNNQNIKGPAKQIRCGIMQDVKSWPKFLLSNKEIYDNMPFIADIWGAARTHQMFPERREPFLMDFIMHEKVGEWLEKYLAWNISYYPELIGSLNFVLPNPFYSGRHIHMIPGNEEPDQVKIEFQPRHGFSLDGLKVIPFEKNYFGITGGNAYSIKNDSCSITLSGQAEKFGMYVTDAENQLIDCADFAGFVRGFIVDIFTGYATKEIHRPKAGKKGARTDYVDVYAKTAEIKEGSVEAEENDTIGERLLKAEILRKRKKKMKNVKSRIFYQKHEEAEAFLRDLIRHARESVIIVDPYFETYELFSYAMAVSIKNIHVEIITSKLCLGKKSRLEQYGKGGSVVPTVEEELRRQVERDESGVNGKINVYVMTGEKPAVHDRFLIIDDEAWFCGGSLNEIGNRLTCIVQLPDSQELMKILNEIKSSDRVRPLKEWRENEKEKDKEIDAEKETDFENKNSNGDTNADSRRSRIGDHVEKR